MVLLVTSVPLNLPWTIEPKGIFVGSPSLETQCIQQLARESQPLSFEVLTSTRRSLKTVIASL